ncbi:hypothetical protein [Nostoc sp. DedQUE09]|uniref:hypothetical protein n=1 Tax=Nostoc sp. DedQUE09 TaxID=3075394 RepID=UPI002AD39000|nr:hypothetical protein [Nostoc sp. DedQUE09]MDZ7951672.1 hypothetical protein [Nostoc sp. DedQUE09]
MLKGKGTIQNLSPFPLTLFPTNAQKSNARVSPDPHFSEIFLVSAFFCAFFAHSSAIAINKKIVEAQRLVRDENGNITLLA